MRVVDLDDQRTWPKDVKAAADRLADRYQGETDNTGDLGQLIGYDGEVDGFCRTLSGTWVKVYHATRLLDDEMERIRSEGMHPASRELAESRIDAAYEAGLLDDFERQFLMSRNLFATGRHEHREGGVWLFGGKWILADDVSSIWSLMTHWGGEIVYFDLKYDDQISGRLKSLGRPAVVVAAIDVARRRPVSYDGQQIAGAFVGKPLGLREPDFELHHRGRVPADQILDIWTPGHVEYDRHTDLPTT